MERSGEWQWEPIPSNRDEDYYAAARYDRDTALAIASAIEAARGDRRVVNLPGSAQRTLNMYRSRGNAEAEWMALQALDKAAVLGVLAGVDVARCDVCDEPCDDLHSDVVDGENLDVCWRCCPCCPTSGGAVCIPADPVKREALANFAGLDAEERAALDQFCFDEEQKRARGVLLHDNEPREAT